MLPKVLEINGEKVWLFASLTRLLAIWYNLLQGAIVVASVSQVIIGYFGIIGLMLKYITPLTVAPSVSMIGMSLFKSASGLAAMNWPISMRLVIRFLAFLDSKQNRDWCKKSYCQKIRLIIKIYIQFLDNQDDI